MAIRRTTKIIENWEEMKSVKEIPRTPDYFWNTVVTMELLCSESLCVL